MLWTHTEAAGASGATPAVTGGVVYESTLGGVEALSAATGATLWTNYPTVSFYGSPTVIGGVVYIASGSTNALYALNANTGAKIWGTYLGSSFASPAVANGVVYGASAAGVMCALNAHTGTQIWSVTTGGFIQAASVANGVVCFMSADDTFYAVDATYGTILNTFVAGGSFLGSPAVSDGVVYTSVHGGNTYAFSLTANTNPAFRRGPPPPSSLHPHLRLPITH